MVVSRTPEKLELDGDGEVMAVGSIEEGLRGLQGRYPAPETQAEDGHAGGDKEQLSLGRVFVIGGAEIYARALEMECCERILWTRLKGEFEYDTFFPGGTLGGDGGGEWGRRSGGELREWSGEGKDVGGWQREGDVEFEVVMVERGDGWGGEVRRV